MRQPASACLPANTAFQRRTFHCTSRIPCLRDWGISGKTSGDGMKSDGNSRPFLDNFTLRPPLDYEVAWRAVKGRDERPRTAPLTALHATRHSIVDVGGKKYGGPPRRP